MICARRPYSVRSNLQMLISLHNQSRMSHSSGWAIPSINKAVCFKCYNLRAVYTSNPVFNSGTLNRAFSLSSRQSDGVALTGAPERLFLLEQPSLLPKDKMMASFCIISLPPLLCRPGHVAGNTLFVGRPTLILFQCARHVSLC